MTAGQNLVARAVTVAVVDVLEVVEVHEDDAARLHVPLRQLVPLTQLRQHLRAVIGAGQRIAVAQRVGDLVPQRVECAAQLPQSRQVGRQSPHG